MNLVQAFLLSFTAFFAIMNPFANLPMFVSLTADNSRKEVNAIARLAFIVATVIVALFALLGNYIFSIFTDYGWNHSRFDWLSHDPRERVPYSA